MIFNAVDTEGAGNTGLARPASGVGSRHTWTGATPSRTAATESSGKVSGRAALGAAAAMAAAAPTNPGHTSPAWAVTTASRATEEALDESPDTDRRPAALDAVRQVAQEYVLAALHILRPDVPLKPIELPTGAIQSVHDALHQKVSLYCLLRAVRIAHILVVERLGIAARDGGGPPATSAPHRQLAKRAAACADSFSAKVAQVYVAEEERQTSGLPAAQARMVTDILNGHPVDHADAERVLGFVLAHYHVGAVLWAHPRSGVTGEQLNQLAVDLARALGARRPLVVPAGPAKVWMWTGWPRPPEAGFVEGARKALSPLRRVRASVGPVASGLAGFRRSHLSARAAEKIAGEWVASWLYEYSDVAVMYLLTSDRQHAQWFVEETLGALSQPGHRFAELRETLRLYLAFGRSRARAAAILNVARNTVAYRVEKAMKLLGQPLGADPLKIRLALEVARVLPTCPGTGPVPADPAGAGIPD